MTVIVAGITSYIQIEFKWELNCNQFQTLKDLNSKVANDMI